MFYSVNSYSSSSGRKGVSGLVSGMDTDEMVKGMTIGTQNRIAQQLANKQLATWKQTAYRETTKSINDFQNKYFTFSAGKNNILSPSFFDSGSIKSSSAHVKVSGSNAAAKNLQIKDIKELATTASLTTSKSLSNQQITGGKIYDEWFASDVSGQPFSFVVDNKQYNFTLADDFEFTPEESLTAQGRTTAIVTALNKALEGSSELKGKVQFAVTDGKFSFNAIADKDGKKPTVALGSNTDKIKESNIWAALNIGSMTSDSSGNLVAKDAIDSSKLVKAEKVVIADALKGKTLTFSFNGVNKKITFNASEAAQYDTPEKITSYLNKKLSDAFGTNVDGLQKVSASFDSAKGGLVVKTGNKYDIVNITSVDKGLVGKTGALNVTNGASNRVVWSDPIKDVAKNMSSDLGTPDADGNYKLTINNVDILINEKDSLTQMLRKIENSDAGVRVTYSTTSDSLSIVAKDSGDIGKINITENSFSKALFGTAMADPADPTDTGDYTNGSIGTNASLTVSFDGGKTFQDITRTGNSFSLDGLNIELVTKADNAELENITFTVENNTDAFVDKMKEFIKDYNTMIKSISDKMIEAPDKNFKPITDEQKKEMSDKEVEDWDAAAKKGVLFNDQYLNKILSDLRAGLHSSVDGVQGGLSSIGITSKAWDTYGQIQMDPAGEAIFRKAVAEDPERIIKMFTNTVDNYETNKDDLAKSGIAAKLEKTFNNFAGTFGGNGIFINIAGKENEAYGQDTLSKNIRSYDVALKKLQTTLKAQEDRYYKQFANMEKYLSNMNSQSSWLSQQFQTQ